MKYNKIVSLLALGSLFGPTLLASQQAFAELKKVVLLQAIQLRLHQVNKRQKARVQEKLGALKRLIRLQPNQLLKFRNNLYNLRNHKHLRFQIQVQKAQLQLFLQVRWLDCLDWVLLARKKKINSYFFRSFI